MEIVQRLAMVEVNHVAPWFDFFHRQNYNVNAHAALFAHVKSLLFLNYTVKREEITTVCLYFVIFAK